MTDRLASEAFLVHAAEALHRFGLPAYRLEAALLDVARALGVRLAVFATPTALTLAFGWAPEQRLALLRVEPAGVDLGRLAELDALVRDVAEGRRGIDDAESELTRVLARPPRWPLRDLLLAGVASSCGAAVLFGGGGLDVALAGALGLVVTVYGLLAARWPALDGPMLVVCGFGAMAVARAASLVRPDVHPFVVALSALIVLLPGLTFTLAVMELASRHLASGTARFGAAAVTLLQLGLGLGAARVVVPAATVSVAAPLPPWALPLVIGAIPLAIGVLLHARRRDLGIVTVASLAAVLGAQVGGAWLGPELGAGLGAFVLGLVANSWSRATNRPGIVPLTTGMILLVPGSFGLRSLAFLLEGDVLVGVEQAFQMVSIAGSLAAGLVLATAIVPVRRAL